MPFLDLYDATRPQLIELISSWGFKPIHAARVWRYLYRESVPEIAAMHELPARLRDRLLEGPPLTSLVTIRATHSDDGLTHKYLLGLRDGCRVETVLLRHRGRMTACLSSQAGCALGCVFCATGQQGFTRNLSTGEIIAQAMHVERILRGATANEAQAFSQVPAGDRRKSLRNIVVMGMGEPLLNYDAVMSALDILRDPSGFSIGMKQITLSTVGVVPGIIRLADEARPFSLAVSLHAATQQERLALIPAARTWPLDALMEACRYYAAKLDRKIFFEWTLIDGANDSAEQAQALARLLRGIPAQINIIPLNATAGYSGTPGSADALDRFRSILGDHGLPVSIRQRRGIDIAAGCGQLVGSTN